MKNMVMDFFSDQFSMFKVFVEFNVVGFWLVNINLIFKIDFFFFECSGDLGIKINQFYYIIFYM